MKVKLALASVLFACSFNALASGNEHNPFLPEFKRKPIIVEIEKEINPDELSAMCSMETEKNLLDVFDKEMEVVNQNIPPEFQENVLGDLTRDYVESSRYIGQSNGHKIYFNEKDGRYFTLDLSKAEK